MHDGNINVKYTLKKSEILRQKKLIEELFSHGSSFFIYPFKFYFLPSSSLNNNQVLFSVSKKYFKNAVDRNKIRRRMKEAYRLNKHILSSKTDKIHYCIAIVYISKMILPYSEVETKLLKVLNRFLNG